MPPPFVKQTVNPKMVVQYLASNVPLLLELGLAHLGIVLNHCHYGVLYLGSYYNAGPYINTVFRNSNLGKLPFVLLLEVGHAVGVVRPVSHKC